MNTSTHHHGPKDLMISLNKQKKDLKGWTPQNTLFSQSESEDKIIEMEKSYRNTTKSDKEAKKTIFFDRFAQISLFSSFLKKKI